MRIKLLLSASTIICLSACNSMQKAEQKIQNTEDQASKLVRDVGQSNAKSDTKAISSTEYENGIWIGKNIVKINPSNLPALFNDPATFDLSVNSLSELAERITMRSGIPTKISQEAMKIASSATPVSNSQSSISTISPVNSISSPSMSKPRGNIRISYTSGNFKSFLDTVAARFGVYWKYSNDTIQFYFTDSRTFQINTIPGDSSFSANVISGAGSASSGEGGSGAVSANNTQSTGVSSKLSVFGSVEQSVRAMLTAHGKVVASPSTGTMTVVDTPDTLDRVATLIESENKSLSRQIAINVTVLAVTLSDSDSYGINWNILYKNLYNTYGFKSSGMITGANAGQLSSTILSQSSQYAGSAAIIQALSEQGKVRRETTASVVTLNNQSVPIQVATQKGYIKSSQTTLVPNAGSTTAMTTATVTAGFNMSVLPHILNNGTVLLQFSMDLSSLKNLLTFGVGNSSVQLPELETRNFLQKVSMKSNETLIISGFEQTDDNVNHQGVGMAKNPLLGGGYKGASNKEVIVILVTPSTMASS